MSTKYCVWTTYEDDDGYYTTDCGDEYYISFDLEPYDFCPSCGRKVDPHEITDDEEY